MVTLYVEGPLFIAHIHKLLNFFHPGGWVMIVEVRIVTREALGAEEFFGVERSVGFAKLCMPLWGYLSQAMIWWHVCIPPEIGCVETWLPVPRTGFPQGHYMSLSNEL